MSDREVDDDAGHVDERGDEWARCVTGVELGEAIARSLSIEGPHFLLCKVNRSHSGSLPRVTARHTPEENKEAFQIALNRPLTCHLQAAPAGVAR